MQRSEQELNWIDRSIAYVWPEVAAKRAASRIKLEMLESTRRYEAGRPTRSTSAWQVWQGSSANSETRLDYKWLRERSRDLVRNNPYAGKAIQVITGYTVGTGIRPSLPKKRYDKAFEDKVMDAWRDWAETKKCDFNGQFNFYGLMMLAWRASAESGNSFIRIIRQSEYSAVPIKLQLLEADFLDTSRDGVVTMDGNYIIQGVEFTKLGERVAYWMWPHHPSEFVPMSQVYSQRIPVDEIMHIYEVLRPGQVIGIPHGVSAFLRLKDLDQYEDAQLKRQMIASCFTVFVKKNDAAFFEQYAKQAQNEGVLPPKSEKVSPGQIEYLLPGEDISFGDPPGTTGYEPYTRGVLRSIAAGYRITYESLTTDLSGVNFSSGRMGWMDMYAQIRQWQEFIVIGMYCQPIWEHFINALFLTGEVDMMGITANWTPPRRIMIDPLKEFKASEVAVRSGFQSKAEVIRELGDDPQQVTDEIFEEQKVSDEAGAMFTTDPKWDHARVNFGEGAYLKVKAPVVKAAGSNAGNDA